MPVKLRGLSVLLWLAAGLLSSLFAQTSGREFMVPSQEVNGKRVGQEEVWIRENGLTHSGRAYRRLDVGVTGTVVGWAVKRDLPMPQLASAPEFIYPQGGISDPRFLGTLRYEANKGIGMTLLLPENENEWNGKLFVTVHGSSGSFRQETLRPWNKLFAPERPMGDISKYERLMLEKGYAVAKTRRNASTNGDYQVVLEDGDVLEGWNLNTHTGFILELIQLAENIVEDRLGRKPAKTYHYGHSAGGMIGRLINYKGGENLNEAGKRIIDGFLNDDSGGGFYLPVVEKDGENILFSTAEDRDRFTPTIEIPHQLFIRQRARRNVPEWVSPVYLTNHRSNASILRDQGLAEKTRTYEVRGISHMGGEYYPDGRDGDVVILDLSRLIDALIDVLDDWVARGIVPPPTRSDWEVLGDLDGDGVNDNPAVALPEIACPLGVYHPYPPSRGEGGVNWTGFAPFDGGGPEPLDGRGIFVDMNLNRYPDGRESLQQAWQRLGLLNLGQPFTRRKYEDCVELVTEKLARDRFLTQSMVQRYRREASLVPLPGE